MVSVCLYFQVHQPFRIRKYTVFDIGNNSNYFEANQESRTNNASILKKVANKCYLPVNKILLDIIKKNPKFKISYSFSGIVLEQFEKYMPEVLDSFKEIVKTGNVEILDETYYHSLAFLYSKEEFHEQVLKHRKKIYELFRQKPKVFRNTELIFNNEIAKEVEAMGYKGILAEGADHILGWRSPNFLYRPVGTKKIIALLKNYRLSDDIAFRFSEKDWKEWPLDAGKFAQWINAVNGNGYVVNLFMDYETFGEHQWESTGIFEFLKHLPEEILKHPDNNFKTPSEVIDSYQPSGEIDVPNYISWADIERDLSAWIGNSMQQAAIKEIFNLRDKVLETENELLLEDWRKLTTSDHFYYMCTKWFADGDVHKYFNPYETPYDAFISFMNVLCDLKMRIDKEQKTIKKTQ